MTTAWTTFFTTVATAAATLVGLMFVVITLVRSIRRARRAEDGLAMFTTPTLVHFCAALFAPVILLMPWSTIAIPAAIIALVALYCLFHVARAGLRGSKMTLYQPDLEDWVWYTIVPIALYAFTLAGAVVLFERNAGGLYVIAVVCIAWILVGIRNAWDVVTYVSMSDEEEAE